MLMTQAEKASIGRSRGKASPDALNFRGCDMFDFTLMHLRKILKQNVHSWQGGRLGQVKGTFSMNLFQHA